MPIPQDGQGSLPAEVNEPVQEDSSAELQKPEGTRRKTVVDQTTTSTFDNEPGLIDDGFEF